MPRSEKQSVFYKHLHANPWPEFCLKFTLCLGLFTGPEDPYSLFISKKANFELFVANIGEKTNPGFCI